MTRKEKLARVGVVLLKGVFAAALSAAIILYLLLIFGQVAVAETADAAARPAVDLTDLFKAVLAVLSTLLTGYLIPWLRAKAGKEKQEMVNCWIDVAVYAAQQLYETQTISDRLDYAARWLEEHNITVDRAQIEAGVKRYKNGNLISFEGWNLDEIPSRAATATVESEIRAPRLGDAKESEAA